MQTTFFLSWSGALGVLIGLIVSANAYEELPHLYKPLLVMRNFFFLLLTSAFFAPFGFVVFITGFFLISTLIISSAPETDRLIVVLSIIPFILLKTSETIPFFAGIFFLIGITQAGLWASRNPSAIATHFWKRSFWKTALRHHLPYFILPFALVPLLF